MYEPRFDCVMAESKRGQFHKGPNFTFSIRTQFFAYLLGHSVCLRMRKKPPFGFDQYSFIMKNERS